MQPSCLPRRLGAHSLVGEPDRGDLRRLVGVGVAQPVTLEGVARLVELPAVELDDHPLGLEVDVDLVAVERMVHQRPREAIALAEGQEQILEGRAGQRELRADEAPQLRGAAVGGATTNEIRQLGLVQPAGAERLVDQSGAPLGR